MPYDPDATSRLLAEAIVNSYRDLVGEILVPAANAGTELALYRADRVVLCHDNAPDPRFIYANRRAQRLWKMSWDEMVGMPSRLSAVPDARAQRAAQLERAARDGFISDYRGIRQAADGTKFEIRDVVIWTVTDATGGSIGQAATFTEWTTLPPGR